MALNVLVNHKSSMLHITHGDMYATFGRVLYTNQNSRSLSGVEVWPGYHQTIIPTYKKMMINIDTKATALYESGSLIQLIVRLLDRRNPDDLRIRIRNDDHVKLEKALKNIKIHVTHRGNISKRSFKIVKLTKTSASDTFIDIDGRRFDIVSYFREIYRRPIQYPYLPCVVVRRNLILPIEVCELVKVCNYANRLKEK